VKTRCDVQSVCQARRGASYRILELVETREVTPVLSLLLVLEYEAALKRQLRLGGLSVEEVDCPAR
jgi:hypothetical protein